MSLPTEHQLRATVTELRTILDLAEAEATGLLYLAQYGSRDGYPTSSLGGGGGGTPMAPVNDPVGELAVTAGTHDRARQAALSAVEGLRDALYDLRRVERAIRASRPATPLGEAEPTCRSCVRLERRDADGKLRPTLSPVHADDRCRWCYDFWRANGIDPPLELLAAHHDGRRITQQMVDQAVGRGAALAGRAARRLRKRSA